MAPSNETTREAPTARPGRKPKSDAQRAVEEAAAEISKIDTALNLAAIRQRDANELYRKEVGGLSTMRSTAVARLRAATDALARRVLPGLAPGS